MSTAIIPFTPQRNQIYAWDALQLAQHVAGESVNCIVSSPPYYGLRDYGVDGQTGLEDTPEAYVAGLVRLFRELRRALRHDGTLWLNLGDSYNGSGKASGRTWEDNNVPNMSRKQFSNLGSIVSGPTRIKGLKEKDLIGIPWRVAFALQADGWYLRSDIIWSKPNPMPESVTDRPTKAHEYIFLLSKSPRYWYDADAIREPVVDGSDVVYRRELRAGKQYDTKDPYKTNTPFTGNKQDAVGNRRYTGFNERWDNRDEPLTKRNRRTVWEVTTKPFHGAHFATFPEDLIEPMILAGCPKTCCAKCGAPHERVVEKGELIFGDGHTRPNNRVKSDEADFDAWSRPDGLGKTQVPGAYYERIDKGFTPTCTCNAPTRAGLCYDPFMGAGTTGLVAQRLGRDYLGSELNPEYAATARARIDGRMNEYLAMKAGKPYMEGLFTA